MQDGQALFDARTTWNGQSWSADLAVSKLVKEGRIPETIIVGVWNAGPWRYAEYYPQKVLARVPKALRQEYIESGMQGKPLADAYLRFLVEELKPAIDRRYATRPGPESTFVMGSSMGGLISLYAICEYPKVFGGAAGLSTHWVGLPTAWGLERVRQASLPLAMLNYLSERLPDPATHKIYIDRGDDALDILYAPSQRLAEEVLRDRGYTTARASSRVFEGLGHRETDWAARLVQPLEFLLGSQ
jgi:enterochelin esterase-like enzyme